MDTNQIDGLQTKLIGLKNKERRLSEMKPVPAADLLRTRNFIAEVEAALRSSDTTKTKPTA